MEFIVKIVEALLNDSMAGMGVIVVVLLIVIILMSRRLNHLEGKITIRYFEQVFQLFPEDLRPANRKGFKA